MAIKTVTFTKKVLDDWVRIQRGLLEGKREISEGDVRGFSISVTTFRGSSIRAVTAVNVSSKLPAMSFSDWQPA